MIWILQDKKEDPLRYIGSFTARKAAEEMLQELEDQDRRDGIYEPDQYALVRRGICYSQESKTCGNCTNCICMLENPSEDCPKVKEKKKKEAEA